MHRTTAGVSHAPKMFSGLLGLLFALALQADEVPLAPGARVIVEKAGAGHRAIVLKTSADRCYVAYEGEDESFDEWVEAAAVRPVKPPVAAPVEASTQAAPVPEQPAESEPAAESLVWSDSSALPRPADGDALAIAWLEPKPRSKPDEPLRFNEARLAQPVFVSPASSGIASARMPVAVVWLPATAGAAAGFAALEGNSVLIYRPDAAGKWAPADRLDTTVFDPHVLTQLCAGDLNNDGTLDLVVLGGPLAQVYFGTADGRHVPAAQPYRGRLPLRGAACGRFFAGANPRGLAVVEGENTFRLLGASPAGVAPVGDAFTVKFDRIVDLAAGDFDGDGFSDLAIATETRHRSTGAWMFFNQNNAGRSFLWPVGGRDDFARALHVADLDHDGRDDLILTDNDADRGERARVVFGSAGRSGWEDPWDLIGSELGVGLGTASVVTGDFNHDGRTDVGIAGRNGLRIYLGAEYRRFGRNPVWPVVRGGGALPEHRAFVAMDFNGDGAADLLGYTPAFATGYNLALNATPENQAGVFLPAPLRKRAPVQASGTETKVEAVAEMPPGTPVVKFLASRAEPYGPYRYRIVVEVAALDDGVVQALDAVCKYDSGGPLQEIVAQTTRQSEQQWAVEVVLPRGRTYEFTLTARDDKGQASPPLRVVVSP